MMTYLKKLLIVVVAIGLATASGLAQDNDFGFGNPIQEKSGNQQDPVNDPLQDPLQDPLKDPLSGAFGGFGTSNDPKADFDSAFKVRKGQNKGTLTITGIPDLNSHSHLYSQNANLEFQVPTVFKVASSPDFKVVGKFIPNVAAKVVKKDVAGATWVTEEFENIVTWSAPIEITKGVNVEQLQIKTQIEGQVCNEGGCLPFEGLTVTAKFKGYLEANPYRAKKPGSDKVVWNGSVSRSKVKPGDKIEITFNAKLDEGWHIYGLERFDDQEVYSPTLISIGQLDRLTIGKTKASAEPIKKELNEFIQLHHEGEVSFTTELLVPREAVDGTVIVQGKLGYQTCDENGICMAPTVAEFQFDVTVAADSDTAAQNIFISESDSKYATLLASIIDFEKKQALASSDDKEPFVLSTFLWYCGLSFLAGLILNVMPCVLPVIGLKMMSFIEQAGENRGRIFALNVAFSLGLMSVFWLLGFLVVIMDFGWGDLLNKGLTGIIVASGIVFAFGLSMMGVWEIPIPGFASSTHASKMAEKEGLGGAFIKGILTTVLATPCVGPMLIPAMTFAVSQSSFVGFAIFTVLGIGMAFPFLMVAVFPGAIRFLPKPGAWMDTFKQVMGFVLIGTVLFLLSTFAKPSEQNTPYILPVMFMLLVIGIGCWWIGRTSIAAEFSDKAKAYVVGVAIIAGGTWSGFYVLGPSDYELEWKPYTNTLLADLRDEGKPIFIDFTGPG